MPTGDIGGVFHALGLPGRAGDAAYDVKIRTDLKGRGLGSRLTRNMPYEAGRSGFRSIHDDGIMRNRFMSLLADDLGFRRGG